jgi:ATP-dependent helicase HrpB
MSATLDGLAIAKLLNDAPIVESSGRAFPVETRYLNEPLDGYIERFVATTIARALRNDAGDVLVFLPGQREIRRVESLLQESGLPSHAVVHSLFGDAPPTQQRAALQPTQEGTRKVILSTNIAETSLTIDGVRVVVDSGLVRTVRFDPRRGMSGLVTATISQASADQRRGRAGRQQPGVCYRLWTESQHSSLSRFSKPEILNADLAPLALELARWGAPQGEGLRFLDPPPPAHLSQAQSLLRRLGALDDDGKLTSHGRAMSDMPTHPRLSHMLIMGKEMGVGALACELAALLEERDLLRGNPDADIDLRSRVQLLRSGGGVDRFARERVLAQTERLRQMLGVRSPQQPSDEKLGILLALAYPERVGMRRGSRFQLVGGPIALVPERSMLAREKFLAIGDVDGIGTEVKAFLAEPVRESEFREVFAASLETIDEVRWDSREEAVIARRVTKLGAIELSVTSFTPPADAIVGPLLAGIREKGLHCLPWTKEALSLRERSEWLRNTELAELPSLSDEHLLATMDEWLAPFLDGMTRLAHLSRLNLLEILRARFSYEQRSQLDLLAPTHCIVPTGSRIPLDYSSGKPVLAVRLQEMFGEANTPTIAGGKVNVVLHLLSPAHRPLAVTQDLVSFWRNAYPDVRKEMRGRYPKHHWPENPLSAVPTKRKKPTAR